MVRNNEESERLAKLVQPRKHECYRNSFIALSYLPKGSTYHEGYGVLLQYGIPLEHGWCVLPDGETIIDVTWLGVEASYHSVKHWSHDELIKELTEMENPTLPLGWYDDEEAVEKYLALFRDATKNDED